MFGDKLKELRKNKNMSQEELGELCGVAKNTISNWENNATQPPFDAIIKISKYFEVTTDYLFGLNQEDRHNIDKLRMILKEFGIMTGPDLSLNELQRALKIVEVMKNEDTEK